MSTPPDGILIHGHIVAALDDIDPGCATSTALANASGVRSPVRRRWLDALRTAFRLSLRAGSTTAALLLLVALGCADASAPAPPPAPVAVVVVAPEAHALVVGDTATLTATPRDATGRPLSGRPVSWRSSDTAVARVAANGRVTAGIPGTASIIATSEGRSARAEITVSASSRAPVDRVEVAPTGVLLDAGTTRQLTAVVRDAAGRVLTGRAVAWTTDNPSVATVSPTGLVAAVGHGYATIVATCEGKSFGVGVSVAPPEPTGYRPVVTVGGSSGVVVRPLGVRP